MPELPPALFILVSDFARDFSMYEDPARADGACVDASCRFLTRTTHEGLEGILVDLFFPEDIERFPHKLYYDNGYGGHTVVKVGRFWIDFTARQFDPGAPFPLVWEDEEDT